MFQLSMFGCHVTQGYQVNESPGIWGRFYLVTILLNDTRSLCLCFDCLEICGTRAVSVLRCLWAPACTPACTTYRPRGWSYRSKMGVLSLVTRLWFKAFVTSRRTGSGAGPVDQSHPLSGNDRVHSEEGAAFKGHPLNLLCMIWSEMGAWESQQPSNRRPRKDADCLLR